MPISRKILAAAVVLAIAATAVTMAAVFIPEVSAWFSTTFGGAGAGFITLLAMPLTWALGGGGATVAAFYAVGLVVLFAFAYWVWHWDIGYKITGATIASSSSSAYDNTMRREPEEPERQTVKPA